VAHPKTSDVISNQPDENLQEISDMSAEEVSDIKRRSVSGVISYTVRTFLNYGVALLAQIAFTLLLSPEEYGVYFIVTAMIGIFTFLSDVGLAATLIQKKAEPTVQEMRTTFTVQQVLASVIFVLVVLLTPYWQATQNFGSKELWLLYALAASFWFASLKTIPSILLERKLRFDQLVIPAMVENTVFYSLAAFLAWRGFGVSSFTYAILIRSVLGVVVISFLQRWPIGFSFDWKTLKGLANFGLKFQANDLLARIKDDLFIFFLGTWVGPTAVGYIGWARQWSRFPYQMTVTNVVSITFPTFARLQGNKERLAKAIEKTLYFISLFIFPTLVGMSLFIFPLLEVLPGLDKWQPAAWSLVFFSLSILFAALSGPMTNTLNAVGHINKTLWLMVMWTVLTWTVTPLLIHFYDYNGVSLAVLVIGAATLYFPVRFVQQTIPFRFWESIWRQGFATLVMVAVGLLGFSSWNTSIGWIITGIVVCGLSYVGAFLLVGWRSLKFELRSMGVVK
jgi:O-antigen/teichoic acid export membrane protein